MKLRIDKMASQQYINNEHMNNHSYEISAVIRSNSLRYGELTKYVG